MEKAEGSKRKKSAFLVILILLLVVVVGGYTYSRYLSSGTAESKAQIAKWSVKIGGNDLDTYTTSSPLVATLTLDSNDYVADGVIAPGRSGTYQVEVDPTGSQVAIDYVIKASAIEGLTEANNNIKITDAKYWIGDVSSEGTSATITGDNGVTISESLADVRANKKLTVKVTVAWENVETNNATDTTNGKAAEEIKVTTSITAKQHLATD